MLVCWNLTFSGSTAIRSAHNWVLRAESLISVDRPCLCTCCPSCPTLLLRYCLNSYMRIRVTVVSCSDGEWIRRRFEEENVYSHKFVSQSQIVIMDNCCHDFQENIFKCLICQVNACSYSADLVADLTVNLGCFNSPCKFWCCPCLVIMGTTVCAFTCPLACIGCTCLKQDVHYKLDRFEDWLYLPKQQRQVPKQEMK